jgi:hypothetical protein
MQQRLIHQRISAVMAQVRSARLTRAALVLNATSPLTPYPDVERELALCSSAAAFSASAPPASLGGAYIGFLAQHRLAPIQTGCRVANTAADTLAVRRVLLHDILHVLLDFGADWPGQLGVFSFVAAQNYCPQFEHAARRLGRIYMTAAPWLRDALGAAEYRARQLAHKAPRLLCLPLEQEWTTPLHTLQVQLNLKRERSLRLLRQRLEPPRRLTA